MEGHLQGLAGFALVYLDDVLIFSENEEQHRRHLSQLFGRFQERAMKVKAAKCLFNVTRIAFLGHQISEGQIQVDEDKLGRLAEWRPPWEIRKR